ncbi:AAA family ATPase [Herpetosiphon llansteffanensis]
MRGLTLGKFAPLHKGHQLMIETALSEVAELHIIIYDSPEQTNVPLSVRSAWLRTLYPQAHVIEAWDGPSAIGNTPEIQKLHEDYVIKQLGISNISHFYSSEFYGEHMSQALGAINRQVDAARSQVPISATQIRSDPYRYREFLHPLVYRDLIMKVVLLGAPSTGKTTLAAALAERFNTQWMPEYGREYWEQHQSNRRLTPQQLVEIAEGHLAREEAHLLQSNGYLFVDTNALTTYHFALSYHGIAEPRLAQLADQAQQRYDLVLVCDTDIPYDDTWDRSGDVQRTISQKQLLAELHTRRQPYYLIRGTLEQRIAQVQSLVQHHQLFQNLLANPS